MRGQDLKRFHPLQDDHPCSHCPPICDGSKGGQLVKAVAEANSKICQPEPITSWAGDLPHTGAHDLLAPDVPSRDLTFASFDDAIAAVIHDAESSPKMINKPRSRSDRPSWKEALDRETAVILEKAQKAGDWKQFGCDGR
jgi:hypothetical protein